MRPPITEIPASEPGVYETPAGESFSPAGPGYVAATYLWDAAEYRRWFRENERHSRPRIIPRVMAVVTVLLIAMMIGLSAWLGEWSPQVIALVPTLTFLLAFRWFGLPFMAARVFARQVPDARHPLQTVVSPQGVRVNTATATGEVAWTGLEKVVETPEFFLFFIADRNSRYLPKRALNGADGLARVRELVRRHGPPRHELAG